MAQVTQWTSPTSPN